MRIDGTRFEEARSDDAGQPNAEGAGFKGAGLIEMDETFYERVYDCLLYTSSSTATGCWIMSSAHCRDYAVIIVIIMRI